MADSQVLKALLPDNPLCGISTYKDTLSLATGDCTRQIKKSVLDGTEAVVNTTGYYAVRISTPCLTWATAICNYGTGVSSDNSGNFIWFRKTVFTQSTVEDFKAYLATQYANGTPVTVWYALATPEETTITVPSGLSGIVEGYLIQDGTPTLTSPIYPTANNVEVWQHSLKKFDGADWINATVKEWDGSDWQ